VLVAEGLENGASDDRSNVHYIKRRVSRTRLVMGLLLIVAIPIFMFLANKSSARELRSDPAEFRSVG
jgi:hypothetical protein